jgi:F-type H+-transporting ATPase subunit b
MGALHTVTAASGSFLITPNVGLMIWVLVVFGLTMLLLAKLAFPRISEALDRRQQAIEESIDSAERTKAEADEILSEYRQRLAEAREQANEIVQRARSAAETHEAESRDKGKAMIAEATTRAEREIQAATERAIDGLRREVADLTVLATEKVTRRSLTDEDQRRLVEEALGELDFASLSAGAQEN